MKSIHFTPEEITAILKGEKTQCRKVVNDYQKDNRVFLGKDGENPYQLINSPYKENEVIYCKESWKFIMPYPNDDDMIVTNYKDRDGIYLDKNKYNFILKNYELDRFYHAITMPEWASRCKIRITGIRAEQLFKISDEDIKKEGFKSLSDFAKNWSNIHSNKELFSTDRMWVWVYTFEAVTNEKI